MSNITFHVNKIWFDMFKYGLKRASNGFLVEYRAFNNFWHKRLYGQSIFLSNPSEPRKFDTVTICLGYPSKDDSERRLVFKFEKIEIGEAEEGIGRELVGDEPVFCIYME